VAAPVSSARSPLRSVNVSSRIAGRSRPFPAVCRSLSFEAHAVMRRRTGSGKVGKRSRSLNEGFARLDANARVLDGLGVIALPFSCCPVRLAEWRGDAVHGLLSRRHASSLRAASFAFWRQFPANAGHLQRSFQKMRGVACCDRRLGERPRKDFLIASSRRRLASPAAEGVIK